jgi:hypothetical protein
MERPVEVLFIHSSFKILSYPQRNKQYPRVNGIQLCLKSEIVVAFTCFKHFCYDAVKLLFVSVF